ncbi:uncharacterized protein LOC118430843 [Branchiostoma floridae]|uniref:Uncharacterized protein LOC118430843 n=1 Tax=Branchiostoma floridae TaxID=7739 RepID=A0A9J7N9D3_BRAFL|nr:uncharacterized protein LOC118430843 [Branchiostoma floridae]
MKHLEQIKTTEAKDRRIALKVARVVQQEDRKKWNKKRPLQHNYGGQDGESDSGGDSDSDDEGDSEVDGMKAQEEGAKVILEKAAMPRNNKKAIGSSVISISRKSCVCGGTDHIRRSSKKCPQNPKRQKV